MKKFIGDSSGRTSVPYSYNALGPISPDNLYSFGRKARPFTYLPSSRNLYVGDIESAHYDIYEKIQPLVIDEEEFNLVRYSDKEIRDEGISYGHWLGRIGIWDILNVKNPVENDSILAISFWKVFEFSEEVLRDVLVKLMEKTAKYGYWGYSDDKIYVIFNKYRMVTFKQLGIRNSNNSTVSYKRDGEGCDYKLNVFGRSYGLGDILSLIHMGRGHEVEAIKDKFCNDYEKIGDLLSPDRCPNASRQLRSIGSRLDCGRRDIWSRAKGEELERLKGLFSNPERLGKEFRTQKELDVAWDWYIKNRGFREWLILREVFDDEYPELDFADEEEFEDFEEPDFDFPDELEDFNAQDYIDPDDLYNWERRGWPRPISFLYNPNIGIFYSSGTHYNLINSRKELHNRDTSEEYKGRFGFYSAGREKPRGVISFWDDGSISDGVIRKVLGDIFKKYPSFFEGLSDEEIEVHYSEGGWKSSKLSDFGIGRVIGGDKFVGDKEDCYRVRAMVDGRSEDLGKIAGSLHMASVKERERLQNQICPQASELGEKLKDCPNQGGILRNIERELGCSELGWKKILFQGKGSYRDELRDIFRNPERLGKEFRTQKELDAAWDYLQGSLGFKEWLECYEVKICV